MSTCLLIKMLLRKYIIFTNKRWKEIFDPFARTLPWSGPGCPAIKGNQRIREKSGKKTFWKILGLNQDIWPEILEFKKIKNSKQATIHCMCKNIFIVFVFHWKIYLRIFQRFRVVKFIEKFKTRDKNLKIEKIIAFDKHLHELFFAFYFYLSKILSLK